MSSETIILLTTASSIGFFHTLLGPDHYLPFIVMSKARQWSIGKTAFITLACGIGHVLSSVLLGIAGIVLGVSILKLENIQSFRGDVAAWLLLAFGLVYLVWGLRRALKNKEHTHVHVHDETDSHAHSHKHTNEHSHVHSETKNLTPWVLFTIFVFGPCEALVPILMYPAAKGSAASVVLVISVFSVTTLATMLAMVLAFAHGLSRIPLLRFKKYSHAFAGLIIFLSGGAIKFLGL